MNIAGSGSKPKRTHYQVRKLFSPEPMQQMAATARIQRA